MRIRRKSPRQVIRRLWEKYLTDLLPDASLSVFAPGSRHKAASLVEALECFEEGLPRANEIIRGIKADLAGAVDTCIEAAGLEPDPVWQKKLLRVRRRFFLRDLMADGTRRRRCSGGRFWTCIIRRIWSVWRSLSRCSMRFGITKWESL